MKSLKRNDTEKRRGTWNLNSNLSHYFQFRQSHFCSAKSCITRLQILQLIQLLLFPARNTITFFRFATLRHMSSALKNALKKPSKTILATVKYIFLEMVTWQNFKALLAQVFQALNRILPLLSSAMLACTYRTCDSPTCEPQRDLYWWGQISDIKKIVKITFLPAHRASWNTDRARSKHTQTFLSQSCRE